MNEMHERRLPQAFCWTRFGPEAGEGIEAILARKNLERAANGGVFTWGIGNSVAPGLAALLEEVETAALLFSPIRSRPRAFDLDPPQILRWTSGKTLHGERYRLPESVRVTSGARSFDGRRHYALICRSDTPLSLGDFGSLDFGSLRNLASGRPLGASQVTAVVRRDGPQSGTTYPVALRASLTPPYFVALDEYAVEAPQRLLAA